MQWWLVGFAVLVGLLNAVQTGSNTALDRAGGSPVWTLVIISSVSLATAFVIAMASGQKMPQMSAYSGVPWWGWIGGVFGAVYVLSMLVVAGRVGAAIFMGITITAATLGSVMMDHFGLLGLEVREAGPGRILGAIFLVIGLLLITSF